MLTGYLVLAAAMFTIGLFGVLTRRNAVGILLGLEVMLNAVNINLVAFAHVTGAVGGWVLALSTIAITSSSTSMPGQASWLTTTKVCAGSGWSP